jgi:hypothetical protein
MTQGRIDKTLDKMRRGGLPLAPADIRPSAESGNGRKCDGCSEPMYQLDRMYVAVVFNVTVLRFHDVCYEAWAHFTQP